MEKAIKTSDFEMKAISKFVIALTVAIVFILFLNYTGREILANVLIGITSSSFGICGGYYVSKKIDNEHQKRKAVILKDYMLDLIKTEIYENRIIFDYDYDKEKTKKGPLALEDKIRFKVDIWDKLKFKIFDEGIEILDYNRFIELSELYKRFRRINLQNELNAPVNEVSKRDILNYIYINLMKIETYL